MGWFSKKETPHEPPSTVDQTTGIDFAKYELDQLGNDLRSIVDIPGAIGQALRVVVLLPVVVALVTWIVFSGRMSAVVFVPFALVAFVLSCSEVSPRVPWTTASTALTGTVLLAVVVSVLSGSDVSFRVP